MCLGQMVFRVTVKPSQVAYFVSVKHWSLLCGFRKLGWAVSADLINVQGVQSCPGFTPAGPRHPLHGGGGVPPNL